MHQTTQNKIFFDLYRGKLSLTTVAMVTRENLFSFDTVSKNYQKIISTVSIQEHPILHQLTKFGEITMKKLFLKATEPFFPKWADKK